MFREKMVTPAIPERVYVLCKIVEKGPISSSELKEKMEPAELNADTSTAYLIISPSSSAAFRITGEQQRNLD